MKKIDFYLVCSGDKIEKANGLILSEYGKEGYVDLTGEKSGLNPLKGDLNSQLFTFLALSDGFVLGTVSIVVDEKWGLPLDEIFKIEADGLRAFGEKCAEVARLAVNRQAGDFFGIDQRKIQMSISLSLFKMVFYCAKARNIDILCITINPKHENFYEALGFESVGEMKSYDTVNGAPALLKILRLKNLDVMKNNFVGREILENPIDMNVFDLKEKKDKIIFSQEF